ncbi:MAG: hypothetical protein QXG16_02820 [Candidatus Anstonellaceae archaeon]
MQPQFLKKENQPILSLQSPEQIQQNLQDICGKLGLVKTAAMIREIKEDDHLRIFSIYSFIKTLEQNIKNKKDFDRNKLDSALTQLIGTYIFTPYGNLFLPYGFSPKLIEDNKEVLSDILITLSRSDLSEQDAAIVFRTILSLAQDLYTPQSPSNASNFLKDVGAKLQDTNIYNTVKILTVGDTRDGRINISPLSTNLFPPNFFQSISLFSSQPYLHPFYYPTFTSPFFSNYPALNQVFSFDTNTINYQLKENKKFFESLKDSLVWVSTSPLALFFFNRVFLTHANLTNDIVQIYNNYKAVANNFQPEKGQVSGTLMTGVAGNVGVNLEDSSNQAFIRGGLSALKENFASGVLLKNVGTIHANILQAYLNYYKTENSLEGLLGSPLSSSEPFSYVLDPNKQPQLIGAYTFTPVDSPIYPANDPAIITENGANFLPYFLIRESNGKKELNCGFFVQIGGQWFHVAVDENKIEDDKLRNAFAEFKSTLSNSFTVGGGIQNLTGSFNGKDTDTIAGYFAFKIQNMAVSVAQDPERDKVIGGIYKLGKNEFMGARVFYINEEELRNFSAKNLYRSPEDLNDLQKRQQAPHFPGLDLLYLAEATWWALATFSSKKLSAGGGTENIGGVLTYYPDSQTATLSAYGKSGPITFVFNTEGGKDIRPSWSFRIDIDLGDGSSLGVFTNSPDVLSLIQHHPIFSTSFQSILKLAEDLKKAQDPLTRYFIINQINYSLKFFNEMLYLNGFSAFSRPILGISLNTPSARYTVGWNGPDGLIGGATFNNFEFWAGYNKDTKEGNLLVHFFNQEFGILGNVYLKGDKFSGVNVGVSENNWGVSAGVKKVEENGKEMVPFATLLFNNLQVSCAFRRGAGYQYLAVGVMYGNDTWRLGFTSTYMTGPTGKKFTLNWGVEYNINNKNYLYLKSTYLDQPYLQLGFKSSFP